MILINKRHTSVTMSLLLPFLPLLGRVLLEYEFNGFTPAGLAGFLVLSCLCKGSEQINNESSYNVNIYIYVSLSREIYIW